MTADFTAALLTARKEGPEALAQLAEKHLSLVGMVVRRFPQTGVSREELYQQGVVGLMKALNGFDPDRGTAFSTYAASVILGELRMLQRQQLPLHIPRTELTLRRRIRDAEDHLAAALHRSPTVSELAAELHMDVSELLLHQEEFNIASTDADEHAVLLPDPTDWQKRIELRDILSRLPDMDQQLILLRHRVGLTQAQAGQRLGLTQMQVSRREKIIRTLLKRALAE